MWTGLENPANQSLDKVGTKNRHDPQALENPHRFDSTRERTAHLPRAARMCRCFDVIQEKAEPRARSA